jgi:hypothetical protein
MQGAHWYMEAYINGTGIIPVKDSHTTIKPLGLASGNGRYVTVTPERTPFFICHLDSSWNRENH